MGIPVKFSRDANAGPQSQGDFQLSHSFTVEIDGVTVGGIVQVEGLGNQSEVIDYQHGEETLSRKRAARLTLAPVTLTRTWANNKEFFNWRKNVVDGKTDRRSVSIIFLSDSKTETGRINLFNCWPSRWKGPDFNAMTNRQTEEQLVLEIEDMQYA
jgi:phage tail-like protein